MPSSADRWHVVPVALLRHAGYPLADLTPLADDDAVALAEQVLDAGRRARAAADAVPRTVRATDPAVGAAVGMLRPVDSDDPGLAAYRAALAELDRLLDAAADAHAGALAAGRAHVAELFGDPWRQQVLQLSGDGVLAGTREWLADPAPTTARTRKQTDLLAMYLQRITTKNETNSHFGPFAVARFDGPGGPGGIDWTPGPDVERHAFLAHWAATALLAATHPDPGSVRPRPHPLAFPTARGPVRFDHVEADGLPFPWWPVGPTAPPDDPRAVWLFDLVDGTRTTAALRSAWAARHGSGAGFDDALDALVALGLVVPGPELPAGEADTVAGLRATSPALAGRIAERLDRFARGDPGDRARLVTAAEEEFTRLTGQPPTRRGGQLYADRRVLFEDAFSAVRDVRLGDQVERFVTEDLAEVYDGMLLPARLRIAREHAVLAGWLAGFAAPGVDVPLGDVLARHRADRDALGRCCDAVDAEVDAARRALAADLLAGWDGEAQEVVHPSGTLRALLAGTPAGPAALCNPDVMIQAADRHALATGRFTGTVGDCHAVRDLLTHGPFAPLLRDRVPDVADHVLAGYRRVLDPDEVLVDIVRAHHSKIAAQWTLDVPHLEVAGRSPLPRADVLLPRDLLLRREHDGGVSVRSHRLPGRRLRLMASVSGSDTVRHDPLAPFTFPRSLGGGLLDAVDVPHLPRVRTGRVVLARRRLRVPVADLDAWRPHRRLDSRDARAFLSATLLRRDLRLPRHCFAKFAHEPKPVHVDWHAPLLVRQFFRQAHGAPPTGVVDISEMFPDPQGSWLTLDGGAHTAEIRCTVFSR